MSIAEIRSHSLQRRRTARNRNVAGWLFIAPVMFGVLAFQIGPVLVSLFVSMTDWSGFTAPKFIGIKNYTTMLTVDADFWHSLAITAVFTVFLVFFSISIGILIALLCNQKVVGVGLFRVAFFTPVVTNVVAIGFVWFWMFEPNSGLINASLAQVGITGPLWLAQPVSALVAVIIVSVWQGVGYPMIIVLSGLQAIPASYHEAAMIDGASAWQRFWRITLPLLTPTIFFLIIWQVISSFQVFGLIYVMTSGGPANATNVLIFQIYQAAFSQGRLGYAAAMGWILFLIVGLFTAVQWGLEKRWVFYDE